jgi:hypothetical protein
MMGPRISVHAYREEVPHGVPDGPRLQDARSLLELLMLVDAPGHGSPATEQCIHLAELDQVGMEISSLCGAWARIIDTNRRSKSMILSHSGLY